MALAPRSTLSSMTTAPKKPGPSSAFVSLLMLGALTWGGYKLLARGTEKAAVSDAIEQYNLVKRSGSAVDACVHAGIVAAAMVQAKDEDGFKHWKAVEQSDCERAGTPMP